jgi:hypothetical protein
MHSCFCFRKSERKTLLSPAMFDLDTRERNRCIFEDVEASLVEMKQSFIRTLLNGLML